jgi:hypothetical protein
MVVSGTGKNSLLPNNAINTGSKKWSVFVTPHFTAGYSQR